MKVLLFDWISGGHHELYVRAVAKALSGRADVVAAVPESSARVLADVVETVQLRDARPSVDASRHLDRSVREAGRKEVELFRRSVLRVDPTHAVHMFGDGVLRNLVRGPRSQTPTTLLLFRPRAHYPKMYGTPLTSRERAAASAYEILVSLWRRRRDAHAALTLDEGAAEKWASRRGARALWFPEPPVDRASLPAHRTNRKGAVLFGRLSPRKGIDHLTNALTLSRTTADILLAGEVTAGYETQLNGLVARLDRSGAHVSLRPWTHSPQDGLEALASARCVVLPYADHFGMSRVLLEAAAVGTPVVATDHGLLGHLTRRHSLGIAVNPRDRTALRAAVLHFLDDGAATASHAPALMAFSNRYSDAAFANALAGALR